MAQDTLAPWAETVPNQQGLMTAGELFAMPDDGWQYELVEGRLVRMPPTNYGHGRLEFRLAMKLGQYIEPKGLGDVLTGEPGFVLSAPGQADTVLAPDVAFVRAERAAQLNETDQGGFAHLAPDLAVEVASPSQHGPEMAAKARRWLAAGTRAVWVVWPQARRVDVWTAGANEPISVQGEGAALQGGEVLPGFALPLADLFEAE